MITDRIQLAGLESYFQDPANPNDINLGAIAPVTVRTAPLNRGKQLEISGIELLIENNNDLQPLMDFQFDAQGNPAPILRISIIKEMFAGLFANPHSHRVHNIAGYLDFNNGTITNGRVMEVDGIPTIVSSGKGNCVWVSKEYEMPDPISIDAIAWELATAKLTPPDSFNYFIRITSKDGNGAALPDIEIGTATQMLKTDAKRAVEGLTNANIKSFQVTFSAEVFEDSYVTERHLPAINENIGRPLLRGINLLEPVKSIYQIYSLTELQSLCTDFYLHDVPGPEIRRITATLDLSAVLVNSLNENVATNIYEQIVLQVDTIQFNVFTAKLIGEVLLKVN